MTRIFLCLVTAAALLIFSCRPGDKPEPANRSNLFSGDEDTVLFAAPPAHDHLLSPDSAFIKSTVVFAGRPLFVDSTIHGSKAGFFLICSTIDTVLKGHMPLQKKFYFASLKLPHFSSGSESRYMIYLSPVDKQARLIAYNMQLQWTPDAPVQLYSAPVKDTSRRHRQHKIR